MNTYFINNIKNLGYQNSQKEKKIGKFFTQQGNSIGSVAGSLYKSPTSSSIYSYGTSPADYSSSNKNKQYGNYHYNNNNDLGSFYSQLSKNKDFSNSINPYSMDIDDKYYRKETNINDNNNRELNSIITSTVGLTNLGNTCFMNTSLQILIHSEDFIQRLLRESLDSRTTPISSKFYNLCREMGSSRGSSYITPSEFKQKFGSKHSLFRGYGQNDTQEFCRILLEDMNSELNTVKYKPKYKELDTRNKDKRTCDKEFDDLFRSRESSIVMDSFYGQIINIFTCTCEYQTYSFQKILDLPLLMGDNNNIYDLLEEYFRDEKIMFETKCEKCGKKRTHLKETRISQPPNILILSFQRINWRTKRKNSCSISFEEELDIKKFIDRDCGHSKECRYTLYGIGNHSGNIDFGHYYAYIKLNDKTWYEFNDSTVRKIGYIDTNSKTVYTLFYKKQ